MILIFFLSYDQKNERKNVFKVLTKPMGNSWGSVRVGINTEEVRRVKRSTEYKLSDMVLECPGGG